MSMTSTTGTDHTHYCNDCEMELAVLYDDRDDESVPLVCGHCGGTNTRPLHAKRYAWRVRIDEGEHGDWLLLDDHVAEIYEGHDKKDVTIVQWEVKPDTEQDGDSR